jgi:hypothetical protein
MEHNVSPIVLDMEMKLFINQDIKGRSNPE